MGYSWVNWSFSQGCGLNDLVRGSSQANLGQPMWTMILAVLCVGNQVKYSMTEAYFTDKLAVL